MPWPGKKKYSCKIIDLSGKIRLSLISPVSILMSSPVPILMPGSRLSLADTLQQRHLLQWYFWLEVISARTHRLEIQKQLLKSDRRLSQLHVTDAWFWRFDANDAASVVVPSVRYLFATFTKPHNNRHCPLSTLCPLKYILENTSGAEQADGPAHTHSSW